MNNEILQVLILATFGGAIIGLYFLYNHLVRKWLGIESWGAPLPAGMRWTLFFGAVSTVLIGLWVGGTLLGRHWHV